MARKPRRDSLIICIRRWPHEGEAVRAQPFDGGINILAAAGDMLNSLALILMQKFLDLTLVVGGFVQRYPDLSAWARQRPRIKSRVFPGNVEKADLPEIEEVLIEAIPAVHGAAKNIVGQVIDIKQ